MPEKLLVRRAAVLGAGVMGAQIAAHLANAGVDTVLFDLRPHHPCAQHCRTPYKQFLSHVSQPFVL